MMIPTLQSLLIVFLLLLNFFILGNLRIISLTRAMTLQGIITVIAIFLFAPAASFSITGWLIAVVILNKVILFPFLMNRTLHLTKISLNVKPIINAVTTLLIAAVVLCLIFWLCGRVTFPAEFKSVPGMIQTAVFTIFTGCFLMSSRFLAFMQVMGYIVFVNGIILLGIAAGFVIPAFLEVIILLDILGFVLMSGIILFNIDLSFDHIHIPKEKSD